MRHNPMGETMINKFSFAAGPLVTRAALLGVLGIFGAALPGCETESPSTEVDEPASGKKTPLGDDSFTTSKKQTVGAAGGEVTVDGATILIPPGALTSDVEIQVGFLTEEAQGQVALMPPGVGTTVAPLALLPHGTNFSQPVQVELTNTPAPSVPLAVAKLQNESDPDWERGGSAWQFEDGKASFAIDAFSIYAVVTDPNGVLAAPDPPAMELQCLADGAELFPSVGIGSCDQPYEVDLRQVNPGEVGFVSVVAGDLTGPTSCHPMGMRTDVFAVTVVAPDTLTVTAEAPGSDVSVVILDGPACTAGVVSCVETQGPGACEVVAAQSGGPDFAGDVTYVVVVVDDVMAEVTTRFLRQ